MLEIKNRANCCGCSACENVCKRNAIRMQADDEGFLYPYVDQAKCVQCGMCADRCPTANAYAGSTPPAAFCAINRSDEIRENSSSGGLFHLLATHIISQNGVVFGARFDDGFHVIHGYAETPEGIKAFQGSKYVQSAIGNSFQKAKEFLDSGRPVLFTGTPCQIAGLRSFLGKDYDKLLCQDMICHGVPSPMVWQKYIAFREARASAKTHNVVFRSKQSGWKRYSVRFGFENASEYQETHVNDPYMRSFLQNLTLRPSCYACAFKSTSRDADITLADFWGIDKVCPDMDDDGGTSLVIIHSEKGRKVFEAIRPQTTWKQVELEKAIAGNPSMTHSVPLDPRRDAFMREIRTESFDNVVRKYCRDRSSTKIKRKLKALYRKLIH